MRAIQIGVLGAGLAFAGIGVYMAQTYISQTQQALLAAQAAAGTGQAFEVVEVLVAARPLRYGEPVLESDVRPVMWPADSLPPGVIRSFEELVPDPQAPRVALRAMEPNEPLMHIKLSEPGQSAGIAAILTPGMRAFTIRVDQNSGISGTLRPSNLIDIYWTGRGEEGEITRLLSSSVKIIALDEDPDQDRSFSGVPRSLTVEAIPETVAILAQGQSTGRLSMSLVGLDDVSALSQFQVDNRTMLGLEAQVQQQAAPVCSVRTRRGADVVLIEIPCNN